VLLLTAPGISTITQAERSDGWHWNLTAPAVRRLLSCGWSHLEIGTYGNVLSAMCSLHRLAAEELTPKEIAVHDPAYPVIIAARAVKIASEVPEA
jgi:hypothetical protein